LKPAPGTWGSAFGLLLYVVVTLFHRSLGFINFSFVLISSPIVLAIGIALLGTVASDRVARFAGVKDPQYVVIDEVSGQWLTLLLGMAAYHFTSHSPSAAVPGSYYFGSGDFGAGPLNWKYLLLGFILFRVFDIWKPFPARQAEALPGGLGIMADDWVAALYAAACLWIARSLGL
jgi:phosphatidylglycerophosphatase A